MQVLILYFFKLSVALILFYAFYHIFLRKLTFYNLNRFYLIGYTVLAFIIPFIDVNTIIDQDQDANMFIVIIPQLTNYTDELITGAANASQADSVSAWTMISIITFTGMIALLIQLIIRLISFLVVLHKAKLISSSGLKIYEVTGNVIPFSFGNSIFVNPGLHGKKELEEIILHEFIHVKEKHTIDIIWTELLCIINWYNPAAWLFRKAIRQNLEFIADNKVLEQGIDRKEYQYLLLKVIGNKQFSIANKFNFSSLKKRIAMMNKIKSARVHMLRFLFVVPLLAVILLAFRNGYATNDNIQQNLPIQSSNSEPQVLVAVTSSLNAQQLIPSVDTIPVVRMNRNGYFVDVIDVNGNCTVVIKDKTSKEIDRVDLLNWNEQLENKYGPVGSPEKCEIRWKGENMEITETKATIFRKDGTKDEYDLTNEKEKNKFETRYGKIIRLHEGYGEGTGIGTGTGTGQGLTTTSSHTVVNVAGEVTAISGADESNTVVRIADAKSPTPVTTTITGPAVATTMNSTTIVDAVGTNLVSANGEKYILDDDFVITISKKDKQSDLDKQIQDLKRQGIDLSFDKIEYHENGDIRVLSGTIKSGKSKSNFVAIDFNKVILGVSKRGEATHFRILVQDKVLS